MKARILPLLLIIASLSQAQKKAWNPTDEVKEGVVNVLLRSGYSMDAIHIKKKLNGATRYVFTDNDAKRIFERYSITRIERTYPGVEKIKHENAEKLSRYYTIEGNFFRDRVLVAILSDPSGIFEDAEAMPVIKIHALPNDYSLNPTLHSHLDLVNAEGAWDITQGSRSIKVALTDPYGYYFGHPDYVNSNGTNQILYVDPTANDETLYEMHGINTAMATAAATNNNLGVSGIGYKTGLMAYNMGFLLNSTPMTQGAHIIQGSWGHCFTVPSEQNVVKLLHDSGVLIVFSAGNGTAGSSCNSADGQGNGLMYPASYDNVISVGGVNVNPANSYFNSVCCPTNLVHETLNAAVDVTAPGWGVGVGTASLKSDGTFNYYTYTTVNGTSFASPMVAGLAALILSVKSDLKPDEVTGIIKSTAYNVDGVSGNSVYAGLGGTGRIDAKKALEVTRDCYTCTEIETLPYTDYNELGTPTQYVEDLDGVCNAKINAWTLTSGQSLTMAARRTVTLRPGFVAAAGSYFSARIASPCKEIYTAPNNSARIAAPKPVEHIKYTDLLAAGEIELPTEEFRYEDKPLVVEHFPNPVTDKVTIKFYLPVTGLVKIKVGDVSGRPIQTILNEILTAGNHEHQYDASKLASGVYTYTIESPVGLDTKKFVVVK